MWITGQYSWWFIFNNGSITLISPDNDSPDNTEEIKEEGNHTKYGNNEDDKGEDINDIIITISESLEKTIKQGDNVTIEIIPIEKSKFSIENDPIFTDGTNSKYLYLKKCFGNSIDNFVTSFNCTVSNNVLRGTYTKLAEVESNKQFSISPDCTLNLICEKSNGGFLGETKYNINTNNLTKEEIINYSLTFNILYYITGVKSGDIFPHKVFLKGIKLNSLNRQLEIKNNELNVEFSKCVYGNISTEYVNAFESIKCPTPDFIPAGTYNKLEIEGFDNGPDSNINIVFEKDLNKSIYGNTGSSQEKATSGGNTKKSSSSKSKTWIIWLIAGILLAILIGIAIVIFVINRKKIKIEKNDKSESNNTSNNISLSKDNNSSVWF